MAEDDGVVVEVELALEGLAYAGLEQGGIVADSCDACGEGVGADDFGLGQAQGFSGGDAGGGGPGLGELVGDLGAGEGDFSFGLALAGEDDAVCAEGFEEGGVLFAEAAGESGEHDKEQGNHCDDGAHEGEASFGES